jgi:hypothetical protein
MIMPEHEPIVSECEGCDRIVKYWKDGKLICACHPFPKMNWWPGLPCEKATHINISDEEDPIKEP